MYNTHIGMTKYKTFVQKKSKFGNRIFDFL